MNVGDSLKRYTRYKYWWYPHIIAMIREFPNGLGNTEKAEEANEAISTVISRTLDEDDGIERVRAINEIYFQDKKNADGVASELYVSRRKVEKWTHDFVYEVAEELGYYEQS